MSTWLPIITAALVLADLVATKLHMTKTKALIEKVEALAQGK